MARDASITLPFADGDYPFRLGWGQLILLQEAVDAGPFAVLGRLEDRSCRVQDIAHVIRLGLIGGGMEPKKALELVRAYVEDRPPLESVVHAQAILSAAVVGAPEEDTGSKKKPVTAASS